MANRVDGLDRVFPPDLNPTDLKSLVIVDDEISYLDYLGDLMSEHLGCPVHTFSRPGAALEAMRKLNVGAVATDYYMPGINGIELVSKARSIVSGVPFILITGHGAELVARGFDDLPEVRAVLNKPFTWRTLADEVIRHWPSRPAPSIRGT